VKLGINRPALKVVLMVIFGLLLLSTVAFWFWPRFVPVTSGLDISDLSPARGIVFVNKTADRKYDRALRYSIRKFQEKTGVQLAVVLLEKLPKNQSIEAASVELFEKERLGMNAAGKGMLFLFSEQERQLKIEVGYALEGIFTDAICRQLEAAARTFLLGKTAFARRDFLTDLMVTMGIHFVDHSRTGSLPTLIAPQGGNAYLLSSALSGGAGIVGRGYAATLEQVAKELLPLTAELALEMQPDTNPEIVIARYRKSLELGIGAPNLPLITEGSRYFRTEKNHAPGYLQRVHQYQQKGLPARFIQRGNLAGMAFGLNHPALPILLRRDTAGLWYVDEAASWAYFHLIQDAVSPPPVSDSFPFKFVWEASAFSKTKSFLGRHNTTPPANELPFSLKDKLVKAEEKISRNSLDTEAYLEIAELLHFEMYWLEAAVPLYEKVLALSPDRIEIHWRLFDVYSSVIDYDQAMHHLNIILKKTPNDSAARWYYDWMKSLD
jgi:tetratricopeptide (TPR) repeat protein